MTFWLRSSNDSEWWSRETSNPKRCDEEANLTADEAQGVDVDVDVGHRASRVTHAKRAPTPKPWAETGAAQASSAPKASIVHGGLAHGTRANGSHG